jgi:hypothetical protein
MLFFGISSTYAQTPSFIVDWNPCELEISGSEYYVQYAIYNTTTATFEVPATWYALPFPQTSPNGAISISSWDCNQLYTKPYLYIFVYVELRKDGVAYCTGSGRSTLLTCSEMFDNSTTIPVNMNQ